MKFIIEKCFIKINNSGGLVEVKSTASGKPMGILRVEEPSRGQNPGKQWTIFLFSESLINQIKTLRTNDALRIVGNVSSYQDQQGDWKTSFIARDVYPSLKARGQLAEKVAQSVPSKSTSEFETKPIGSAPATSSYSPPAGGTSYVPTDEEWREDLPPVEVYENY